MSNVMKSAYRQPPTVDGLKAIEHGTMEYFDTALYSNLNTGVLEQYLNEKNRTDGFSVSKFDWKKVAVGICLGTMFAIINQYTGLKVGLIVGGTWYISYLFGLWRRWEPTEINIASGAGTGAEKTATGFVFTFPAIYLLAKSVNYVQADGSYLIEDTPSVSIPLIAAMLGAMLGVMYFTLFRRVWLVEDPLPVPGFEAFVKLADIANDLSSGAVEHARRSIQLVTMWCAGTMFFTFLRDFPIFKVGHGDDAYKISILEKGLENVSIYHHGSIVYPHYKWTFLGFGLIPIQLAVGWFMKFRTALLVSIGTLVSWFLIVPLAVGLDAPVYVVALDANVSLSSFGSAYGTGSAFKSYGGIARVIAIGAILGGGMTSLAKMAKVFRKAGEGMFTPLQKGDDGEEIESDEYVKGKGWYEWPLSLIPVQFIVVVVGVSLVFIAGDFPVVQSIIFGVLLAVVTFFLGAIAVKVMGETGITPVSGTSFIVFILLFGLFKLLGTSDTTNLIMSLVGTTVFGTSISLAADITHDFKIGMYMGTRPYHLVKGELAGIVPGTIIAALVSVVFSTLLAEGDLKLDAPQAHAFATIAQMMVGGNVPFEYLILGIFIGIWAELTTGMGTAFGLGMYLKLPITLPLLVGGAARNLWIDYKLNPSAEAGNWSEAEKTMVSLETYMRGTGLIVGEALMGTIVAFYYLGFD